MNLSNKRLMPNRVPQLLVPQLSLILSRIVSVDKVMNDEILTLKEIAEYLKLAEKTAYRLAAEGKLPGFKSGGSWRFKQSDIEKWIEQNKKG
jgi:excisionase family DNA binding protein